jgi:predicted small lipoprotein YifL
MTMPIRAPLLLAAAAALLAAGCGVKGDPQLPEDKADGFPRTYPQGAVPSESRPENIFVDKRR